LTPLTKILRTFLDRHMLLHDTLPVDLPDL